MSGEPTSSAYSREVDVNNLADGTSNLSAYATDIAGNISSPSNSFTITIDSNKPTLTLTTPVDTAPLQQGARLVGIANGTGSAIDKISYRFDNQTEIPVFLNLDGSFNQQLDLTGFGNSDRKIRENFVTLSPSN